MVYRSSFSQHWKYLHHPRYWFYEKVLKIPSVSDMCYANGGTILHECLEKHYKGEFVDMTQARVHFENRWGDFKLETSKIGHKKDEYWLMFVNGVNLEKNITSTELKIFYPDVLGYMDAVNTDTHEIYDWKSSTRSEDNEVEYTHQLKYYAWLYHKKFGVLPSKCVVYYLKYNGSKDHMDIIPTLDDVESMQLEHDKVIKEMEELMISKKLPACGTCSFFCPYKDICEKNELGLLSYTLHLYGDFIVVEGSITDLLNQGLVKKFSYELKNSFFMKKHNPYANTHINFWDRKRQRLPIGFLHGVEKTLKDYAVFKKQVLDLQIIDHRTFDETIVKMPDKFVNGIELRNYQLSAVDAFIDAKIGLLEIGTGGGKSEIAFEIIRRLRMKTLFVVDKIELLNQTKKRLEDALGIEVGVIGAGIKDIKDVTVATIQTLKKNIGDYKDYLNSIRFVVFDECHHASAESYQMLGKYLKNTQGRLGITATNKRDDGNDLAISSVVGFQVFDLSSRELIANGWLMAPDILFVKNIMTGEEVTKTEDRCGGDLINPEKDYSTYYEYFIVKNDKRNQLIKNIVDIKKGNKILIVVKLIEHGTMLVDLIPGSFYLHGSVGKKERDEVFNGFVNGDRNILISTISIFAEGINMPSLDMVINASGNRGDVKSIQVLGRVLRKHDGKDKALYVDFFDDGGFLTVASISRRKAFMKEGHEVLTIESNRIIEVLKNEN